MTSPSELERSDQNEAPGKTPATWLRLGLVAGASAVAGGVAAAWWYRKTLAKLRQAEENATSPCFGSPSPPEADEE